MNSQIIEDAKQEMIAEAIPLCESKKSSTPSNTEFVFDVKNVDGYSVITMTVIVEGSTFMKKSRKLEQLNG